MKKLTCVLIMLTLLGSGCKFVEKYTKKGKKAKAAAMQKAKEDSLAKAKAIEFEKAAQAREQARQDSIRQVEEYESQHRFHVIIGSFRFHPTPPAGSRKSGVWGLTPPEYSRHQTALT
jgi:hypothetical protein